MRINQPQSISSRQVKAPNLLIDLHYLPCIEYFACLLPYETIYLEAQGNYQKQTYSNRCYILTSQKADRLSVPVIKSPKKQSYADVKIDNTKPWRTQHWRAICTAYGKAPYFEYLADHLGEVLQTGYTHLFELNRAILQLCLQVLGMQKEIKTTDSYMLIPHPSVVDVRAQINLRNRLNKPTFYQPFCYQQVFGTVFNANLSIIDLLFCEGPHAYALLKRYSINPTKFY
jgi:hypothetical protein